MAERKRTPRPRPRYRVICYELVDGRQNLIMDVTDDGFIAATGAITHGTMSGELAHAGPHELQAHLALMIANDDQLAGRHSSPDQPR